MPTEFASALRDARTHREKTPDPHGRLDSHEEVCALRWGMVLARMDRLERILLGAAGALIMGMAGLLVTLLLRGHT